MKYMIFDRQHTTYDIRYTIYAEDLKDEVDLNHEQDHNNDDSLKLDSLLSEGSNNPRQNIAACTPTV